MNQEFSIVLTSINPPTADVIGLRDLAEKKDVPMTVVGDRKTPTDWRLDGVDFFSFDEQAKTYPILSQLLSENHYSRKNLGYLAAYEAPGDWIYETDDDNIPLEQYFEVPNKLGYTLVEDCGWVNVYAEFAKAGKERIWPRGYPLELVQSPNDFMYESDVIPQAVVQGLVDGDPDVDAIYRLTCELPYYFKDEVKEITLLNSYCPFNSQNTWWNKDVLALMYLPTTVTPRVTDILRSYVTQAILYRFGLGLSFTQPTAIQRRNEHNLIKDFKDEILLYIAASDIMESIEEAIENSPTIHAALYDAYKYLAEIGYVESREPAIVMSWLAEVQRLEGKKASK